MKLLKLFKNEISSEAKKWVDEKIIDRSQADKILERYGAQWQERKAVSTGYYILLTIASLFAGLSVIILLSHNWNEIPRYIRMGLMFLFTISSHSVGLWYLKKSNTKAANVWFFLGCIIFGSSIFLIAQIYHLGEHYPDGFFYWALGIIPFLILTRSNPVVYLFTTIAASWMFLESGLRFYPAFYFVFLFITFWHLLYRKKSTILFVLNLFLTGFFLELSLGYFLDNIVRMQTENVYFTFGLYALTVSGGIYLRESKNEILQTYAFVMNHFIFKTFIVFLFIFSFSEVWEETLEDSLKFGFLVWWLTVVLFITGGMVAAEVWVRKHSFKNVAKEYIPLFYVLFVFTLSNCFVFFHENNNIHPYDIILATVINFMLVIAGIWFIFTGVQTATGADYYFGVFTLLMTAVLRYFNLIDNYLTGAGIFFLAAVIMFLAARWWQKVIRLNKESDNYKEEIL